MSTNNEQVSTKEFLKSIFNYFQFLGRNWQILLIAFLIGYLYDTISYNDSSKEIRYGGLIEFNIDLEGGNNQLGGIAGVLGIQPNSSTQGLLDMSNFTKIMTSETVFKDALMTEVELFGKKDLFINFYVDSSGIQNEEWGKKFYRAPLPYGNYKFLPKETVDFTNYENIISRSVILRLKEETLLRKDDESSMFILQAVTYNELLTKAWLETLLKATENFYTEIKTKKTKKLISLQQKRTDSLAVLLKNVDRGIARTNFEQFETVDPYAAANTLRLNRDNSFLSTLYVNSLNNLETLKNLMIEQTQIFQILTPVTLPLATSQKYGFSVWRTGWILLIAIIFVISFTRSYKEIMKDENEA